MSRGTVNRRAIRVSAVALIFAAAPGLVAPAAMADEQPIQFERARNFPASTATSGGQAGAISSADFNRDGHADVVVSNCGGGGPSVLLNSGDGTFGAPQVTPTDPDACAVGVGDFNDDGSADVVAGSWVTSRITVLLGDGAGGFDPAGRYFSGLVPMQFAMADYNGDGHLDIASMNYTPGTVAMLLGRGDGQFVKGKTVPAANMAISIASADLDDDGDRDMIVTDGVPSRLALRLPGDVNVLLNNGDGTFARRVGHPTAFIPEYLEVADLDDDGRMDLVVGGAGSFDVSILYGQGNARFEPEKRIPVGDAAPGLQLADFDGDGILDIAAAQAATSGVRILRGDGARRFISAGRFQTTPTPSLPESFVATDFDGDDCPDLAVAGNFPALAPGNPLHTAVSVLINASPGC